MKTASTRMVFLPMPATSTVKTKVLQAVLYRMQPNLSNLRIDQLLDMTDWVKDNL